MRLMVWPPAKKILLHVILSHDLKNNVKGCFIFLWIIVWWNRNTIYERYTTHSLISWKPWELSWVSLVNALNWTQNQIFSQVAHCDKSKTKNISRIMKIRHCGDNTVSLWIIATTIEALQIITLRAFTSQIPSWNRQNKLRCALNYA